MNPLGGRELGIARQQLSAVVRSGEGTTIERVELALIWFVNGDGIAFPTLDTIRRHLVEQGQPLHRSTLTAVTRRLPHFLTVGYFARNGFNPGGGALRGAAVRIVRPDLAEALGFPPLEEALERLQMYRWLLLTEAADALVASGKEASSGEEAQSRISPLKTPTPRRLRKNATQRSLSLEIGDVTTSEPEKGSRARARRR